MTKCAVVGLWRDLQESIHLNRLYRISKQDIMPQTLLGSRWLWMWYFLELCMNHEPCNQWSTIKLELWGLCMYQNYGTILWVSGSSSLRHGHMFRWTIVMTVMTFSPSTTRSLWEFLITIPFECRAIKLIWQQFPSTRGKSCQDLNKNRKWVQ